MTTSPGEKVELRTNATQAPAPANATQAPAPANATKAPAPAWVDRLTDWLYRFRGETAAPFAVVLLVLAHPTPGRSMAGLPLVVVGEALRLWAASHIGSHARGRTIRVPRRVTTGPYTLTPHPLYLGNALVCAGLLITARAGEPWFPGIVALAFLFQYGLFMRREEAALGQASARSRLTGTAPHDMDASWRPIITRDGFRLEWPTLRTLLVLLLLLGGVFWLRLPD